MIILLWESIRSSSPSTIAIADGEQKALANPPGPPFSIPQALAAATTAAPAAAPKAEPPKAKAEEKKTKSDGKFCPNCGSPVKEGEKFCSSCGNKVE